MGLKALYLSVGLKALYFSIEFHPGTLLTLRNSIIPQVVFTFVQNSAETNNKPWKNLERRALPHSLQD